jgi:hypothetical protein
LVFKIQMMKGLHVMSRRVLQLTDQACVGGVLSNRKPKKALGLWSVLQGHNKYTHLKGFLHIGFLPWKTSKACWDNGQIVTQ